MAKRKRRSKSDAVSPQERLLALIQAALDLTRTAKRNHQSLTGQNYYADKIVALRAEATNCYRDLSRHNVGQDATLAEVVELVFGATTSPKNRTAAARELVYALKTTYRSREASADRDHDDVFPLSILSRTGRAYLVSIGRQMNGAHSKDWHDAAIVMMRRLLEIAIIEAFEAVGSAQTIKDTHDNFLQLSGLVKVTLAEMSERLSRNTREALPRLRDIGHLSAHGRYYNAKRSDIDKVQLKFRVALEELLHIAKLL